MEVFMNRLAAALLFICLVFTVCPAAVLFQDNFDRANGAVGNDWTNVGPATTSIITGTMKIVSDNNKGIKHDFTATTSPVIVEYDWKIATNNWTADAFPNDIITHLLPDYDGHLNYDAVGDYSNPVAIADIPFNTWTHVRMRINPAADVFSVWVNGTLVANGIAGNAITSFSRWTFRASSGANVTQYVDNFVIADENPPTAPTNFTATGNVDNIVLTWTPPANTILVSTKVYRGTTANPTTLIATLTGSSSTWTDTTALPDSLYYYRARTECLGVASAWSAEVTAHRQPRIVINPQNLTVNVGQGYIGTAEFTIQNTGSYPLEWNIEGSPASSSTELSISYNFAGSFEDTGKDKLTPSNTNVELTTDRFGVENNAALFSGNSILRTIQNVPETNYTQNVWIRTASTQAGISSVRNANDGHDRNLWFSGSTCSHRLWSEQTISSSSIVLSDNRWHMITVIVSQQNGQQLYIDGNLAAYGNKNQSDFNDQTLIDIGYDPRSNLYFSGLLDDFCLVSRPLTSTEVGDWYHIASVAFSGSGIVNRGSQYQLGLRIDATNLAPGSYLDTLYVQSNDPIHPSVPVVVTVNVLPPVISSPGNLTAYLSMAYHTVQGAMPLGNTGQGKLNYSLVGTDTLGSVTNLPAINGFTPFGAFNGHQYYTSNNSMSWQQARIACQNAGGHLVTIGSEAENNFIAQSSGTYRWIGITDENTEGQWAWVTNEPVTYTRWASGEPNNANGNEDYAVTNWNANGNWNDLDGAGSYPFYLEIDHPNLSMLTFTTPTGTLEPNANTILTFTINGNGVADGVHHTSVRIYAMLNGVAFDSLDVPVTVNLDFHAPSAVLYPAFSAATASPNSIRIHWRRPVSTDQVVSYKVWRRIGETGDFTYLAAAADTVYTDSQFTAFDIGNVYYKISAIDWVGNEGALSEPVLGWLDRFNPPSNVQLAMINNQHDARITWSPVTTTISGASGTPDCYIVYYSETASPVSAFYFLGITTGTQYVHPYIGSFVEGSKMFYMVTSYSGSYRDMATLNELATSHARIPMTDLPRILKERRESIHETDNPPSTK
jgi:hypothetical protein